MRIFISVSFLYFLLACAAHNPPAHNTEQKQQRIIRHADDLLKKGAYREANRWLKAFLQKYPDSFYADDAAYRLAYMKTISDPANPYFDYRKAQHAFQQFNEQFPRSAYLSACNNWQKILNLYFDLNEQAKTLRRELAQRQKTIDRLTAENKELRRTLTDLEKALER